MMRTSYDPEADAFMVRFAPKGAPIERTEEVAPGVLLDFDADGQVIGIEVLYVRRRMAKEVDAPKSAAEKPAAE
jgi:uncharacterized protein YuzE